MPAASRSWPIVLLNFLLFQAGWFACVIAAAHGRPGLGVLAVLAVAAVHLGISRRWQSELQLLFIVTVIGVVWDSVVVNTGWMSYSSGTFMHGVAPSWIIAMWTLFGTLLNVSLRWMRGRNVLAVLFGLIGGPLAYYGGVKLGAVNLNSPIAALALQGAGWAVLTPWLIHLGERFDV